MFDDKEQYINDRKNTEEKLRESENRFQALVESSFDVISIHNSEGKVVYAAGGTLRVLGYFPDEFIGRTLVDFIYHEDLELAGSVLVKLLQHPKEPTQFELRMIHKDGSFRWVEGLVQNLLNDPNIKGIIANFRDITERKRHEQEMLKSQRLESIGTLAGGIAHDFNNILTAILGNIELAALSSGLEESALKRLKQAEKAVNRAAELAQQLLTFAKGGAPLKTRILIPGLVRDSAGFVLRGANVTLECSAQQDLWPAEIDGSQIAQAIQSFVLNARQAMPSGGIVTITMQNILGKQEGVEGLKDAPYIKISIKDSGVGISKTDLPRIFDPYFTTKQSAAGLGLATSYSIIKKHEGWITVESELKKGSVFSVYLPASAE
jgi:PAS domain S-box-containing protein